MKKIFSFIMCITIIVVMNFTDLYACAFHDYLPTGDGSEVIDTVYIEYVTKTPEFIEYEEEEIATYIYIIEMEDYLWVENAVGYMTGLYVIGSDSIDSIVQSETNQDFITVTLKDGEVFEIDTVNQQNYDNNVFYLGEDELGLYVDIREEYLYIYEDVNTVDEEIVAETLEELALDQFIEETVAEEVEEIIENEKIEKQNNIMSYVLMVIAFALLIRIILKFRK